MKSLVTQLKESLVTETNNTVCELCPVFDPDKPNQKEFEEVLLPIFNKLKDAADKEAKIFGGDPEENAAVVKGAMDFLIRNIGNIADDFADEDESFSVFMSDVFADEDYDDAIADDCETYYDFDDKDELYDAIERVRDDWDKYCKKVVKMTWE